MKDKKCYNPPDRRRKKKVSSRSIAAKIASSMLATVTAATTIASPVLTYAADANGMDTVTETTTDASQGETKTIISTDSDSTETEKDAETKFLLINLKTSGGKVVIDENEDDEQTVKLANHKSDDGKTDEMRIDVYDKDDILVSSEDAAKNSYTYAYEVKADSVTNVKADADEGYILKLYDIVEGDTEKDSGFDEKTDGIAGEFEYPVFMDSNVTVKVEFEKEEVKEDGKTETEDSAETGDLTVDESTDETEKTDGNEKTADSNSTDADAKDSSDSTGDLTVNDNVYVSPNGQTQTEIGTDENSNDAETDEDKVPDNEDTADTADDSTAETADNADSVEDEADAEDSSEAGAAEEDAGDVTEEDAEADSAETDTTDTDTAEHFTDTSDAEGGLNKDDFSSARLLVMTDDENDIIDKEHMIGSYGDIYLLQYESAEQAMTAYSYYKEHVDAVEPDAKIAAASENVAGAGEATTAGEAETTTEAMTKDDNAVAALNTEESSSKATVYSDDTANKVIALIDTGAAESSNVIDRVSLIDDVLNGGTHGDDMVNDIVSQDPEAKILSIRALGNDGFGTYSAVVSAVEYAINSEVDIINLSMYSPKTLASSVLETEIQKAIDSGITVVGAAGNDGKDASGYVPGAIDDAYIIGAATKDGVRIAGSNYGTTIDYYAVAGSTSEAAAKFSGYISKNGLDKAANDKTGLLFNGVANINTDIDVVDKDIATSKDNDTIYDPIIEKYVKEHADKSYVGEGEPSKLSMVNVMDVDATIASADQIHKNETIESMMSGDDFRFLFQQTGYVPVYQLGKDSDYFVAFADVMHNDKRASVVDLAVARNDVSGDEIDGIHYDKDSGLLYIPKTAFYGEDGKYYVQYLQTQILYSIDGYDVNSAWNSSVIATTEETDGDTESAFSGADIMNQRMTVQVGKNMDVNTMMVSVNGFPLDGKYYAYSPTTGMMTIGMSSAVVQSVWVQAVKDKDAPDVEPGMVAAGYSMADMQPVTNKVITANLDKLKRGYVFESSSYVIYPDAAESDPQAGLKQGNTVPAYRNNAGGSESYVTVLLDYVSYGNLTNDQFLQNGQVYTPVKGAIYPFIIKLPSISCTDIKFNEYQWETNMAMECTEASVAAGHMTPGFDSSKPTSGWYEAKIRARVVEVNKTASTPYAVLAMYTSKFAGQHGFGLYKVLLKPSTGKLQLTKVSGNASGVSGNASYKLSGAKYGIYSDSGCKKLVKTIQTGTNAKAVVSLNSGTYYIKETTPSLGYDLDKTVHKVTIGAGSTSNVTSTEPPNPGTLTVKKRLDMFSIAKRTTRIGNMETTFTVYTNKECTKVAKNTAGHNAVISIDKGKVETAVGSVKLWAGTYYVKETGRISGTASNIEYVYGPVSVKAGKTVDVSSAVPVSERTNKTRMSGDGYVRDIPFHWSGRVLRKQDTKGNALAGAVFKMNYSDLGGADYNVKYTWYFVSDAKGELRYDKDHLVDYSKSASAEAKAKYKGKSSALFQDTKTGNYYLPVCTIKVQEVMAPDGYNRDSTPRTLNITAPDKNEKYNTWTNTVAKLSNTGLIVKNDETQNTWSFRARAFKVDEDGKPLAGAWFRFYLTEADAKAKEHHVATLETRADGYTDTYTLGKIKGDIPSYTLYCREVTSPPGYALSDTIYTKTFAKTDYDALKAKDENTLGELQTFGDKTGIVNKKTGWNYSMQVKKVDDKGRPLAGAVFSVYASKDDVESEDNTLFTLKTGANGLTPLKTLKADISTKSVTYYCKETSAPEGYTINDGIFEQTWTYEEFNTIPSSQETTGKTKYFGPETGVVDPETLWTFSYYVKKVDNNGNPLAGAVFGVYTDNSCSEASKIQELETNDEGLTDTIPYNPGYSEQSVTLYCKELKAPEGYSIDNTVHSQTWNYKDYTASANTDTGEVKPFGPATGIVNDNSAWTVMMNIKKVSRFKKPLAGAVFGVYSDENCSNASYIGDLTTGDGGMSDTMSYDVPWKNVSVTLYCKETKAPSGYRLSNTVYKQTWYRAQYEELKKKAEQEQQAEGNADTSEGDGEDGGETDTTVGEVKPFGPIDGIPNDPTNWRLQFKVKKVDMKGNPLAKAEFTVYADKACTKALAKLVTKSDGWSDEAFLKTESIDGNGQASQYKLYCKETKAPEFYKLSDTVYEQTWTRKGYDTNNDEYGEVKIFGAESGIPNEPLKPVTVTVHKESKAASEILGLSGYSLEGAEFSITDGGSFKGTLKTNAKGISNSLELPNKTAEYTITETKAPAGHAISTPASQKLKVTMPNDASKDLTVTFSDDPVFTKNEFQITKKSEKNNVINGVLFKVEFVDSDNTTKKTWYLTSDSSGIVKMDNTHLNTDTAYKSDSFYTYNGKVVIPIGGKLKITEIKAPGQYVVDSTPKYLTTGTNATMKLEAINKLKPCKITIRKYDVDGKTPLKGVTFELKFIKEAEKLTTARDGFTRLLKVGGTTTGTTDANGYVVFDNLDQGEYQITEIKTTSGHTLLKDPIIVTLPITMTKEEAAKNKADTSKATWDAATNKWQFYDCTFEVVNSATFKMPMSGGAGDWKYGIIGFGTLAVLGTGLILMDTRKKRMLNSRKQKRRRK